MTTVVHIMPTIPPMINGVGDFGYFLSQAMSEQVDLENFFLVKRLPDEELKNVDRFDPTTLIGKLNNIKPQVIILHFANYSYHNRGLPFYLVNSLKTIKSLTKCKILIYFHELYSSSHSIFKLSFYTNFLQKRIVRKLYCLADHTFTNCEYYQLLLYKIVKFKDRNTITGLFSNISDVLYNSNIKKDDHSMVIFGSLSRRNKVYNNPDFCSLIKKLNIKDIYDIGFGKINPSNTEVSVHVKGALSIEEVAYYLNKTRFGGINYPPQILGKSGILSAYAAFGVIPVNFTRENKNLLDGLKLGENYIDASYPSKQANLENIKQKVCAWYQLRNRDSIARTINEFLFSFSKS